VGVSWPVRGSRFWESPARATPMPVDVGAGSNTVQPRDSRALDIVHFTAELAPIAKARADLLAAAGRGLHSVAAACMCCCGGGGLP
jgi:hypothetical protein